LRRQFLRKTGRRDKTTLVDDEAGNMPLLIAAIVYFLTMSIIYQRQSFIATPNYNFLASIDIMHRISANSVQIVVNYRLVPLWIG
jgi:hypothetical protein